MFQDAPIYTQLISERGDIPAQTRQHAEQIRDDLATAMRPLQDLSRSAPVPARRGPASGQVR